MAEEILSNDELLDSNEVLGNDSEPKPGSGKDLLKKAVKKGSITNDYVLGKSYLLDEQKGKKVMGDAFLPYKPKFASLYTEAQKNYELRLAKKKAEDQGFWGEAGGAIAQALAEIVGGTVEGAGYLLDFKSMGDGTFGEGNWFSYLGTALKDWTREVAPIHVDPEVQGTFSPASREWWFSNVPSIASALSILIPVAGWARGVGMVGKGVGMGVKAARAAKLAKLAKAGKKATGLGGLNGIDDAVRAGMAYQDKFSKIWNAVAKNRTLNAVHQGIVSRHIESSMEASGVYQEVYEQVLAETGNEAEAKYAASDAAAFSYKGNSVLVFQDIPQYILLGRGLKATRAFNGRAQMVAAGKSGTKGTMKSAGRYMSDMASEFGEEAWQFVVGEEAIHFGNVMGGIAEDSNFSSRFGEYLEDGEFWTAGFFGAIGAGVMQAAKPIYDKIKGKSAVDSRIKELEDRGARFAYHNKKIRAAAESGLPDIYEQAMLDASSDMAVTAAREGNLDHYRQELETLKTADAETRKKMGVDETFVENIDRLINDANTVEQLWDANVNRFDPSILPYVVQSKFAISKLDKDRGKLISKINENRNGVYRYNELSAEGRIVFDAKLNITAAERGVEHAKKLLNDKSRKLTKEQKENIQEYIDKQEKRIAKDRTAISAVEADDSIALPDSDKDILKLLDNEALIGEAVSNIEKLSWQDQLIDAHIKRLNSLTNREIIGLAAKNKANLDKGREDFRRVQDLYTKIYKGAKEEILGKRKTIGVDKEGKPIKEKSDDWKDKEGSPKGTSDFELTRRYEVELTPKEKQAAIDEAKEILARTTDEQDKENIAKMIEKMEEVVNDGISRFQQQEKRKLKAIRDAQARALKKIKQLEAQAKRKETLTIKNEIALAYDQYEMIDHAYDDVPLGDLFIDDSDVLSVFYKGEKGTLFKNDLGEAVFKSSSSGEEIIISSSGNLEWNKLFYRRTASDLNLGIVKDSYYPIDITFDEDHPSIWIGDNEFDYSGNFPQESIKYDKAGNLKSVTLINKNTGNPIEITGEILMYEIADLLLVYQLALEEFLYTTETAPDGTTRQIPGTFVVNGIEYQVDYNIKDPSKSKVFSVLRIDDEWVADKEMLLARRDYVINEVSKQFAEQLTADIEGYVDKETKTLFAPRIQRERETVREYVKRGEGPLTKKSGETKDEFAERTADTKYEIKGHNKWILNKQNKPWKDEETDSKDIPPQPPAGPETQKETDGTESTGASKGDPQTEDEIVNQIPDGDLPTSELELIAINKALQELEPKASQLTEDLKNAQSIEDLQRLLIKKTEELAGTTNVDPTVAAAEAVPPSPIYKKGKSTSTEVKVIKRSSIKAPEDLGLTATAEAKAAAKPKKTTLSAEEVSNLDNEIKRIKNFIKKVETEFDTIKDEAVKAKLAAKKSTVLVDEDVEIGDVRIELTSNLKGLKKVEENGNRYYEDKDGNKYIGMSNIVNPSDFEDEKGEWTDAKFIGNAVDEVLRNFFAGKPTEYTGEIAKRMSEEAYNELLKTAEGFKESLKDENGSLDHIEFLTEGLFIANNDIKASQEHINKAIEDPKLRKQEFGIATEMDMVIVNKKTNTVELVDFKAVRLGKFKTPESNLKKEWGGKPSKKHGYTKQQNASRIILELNTGIKFEALSLLPIASQYGPKQSNTTKAKVSSRLMPLDKLEVDKVFPKAYAEQIKNILEEKDDSLSTLEPSNVGLERVVSILPPFTTGQVQNEFQITIKLDSGQELVIIPRKVNKNDGFKYEELAFEAWVTTQDGFLIQKNEKDERIVPSNREITDNVDKFLPAELIELLKEAVTLRDRFHDGKLGDKSKGLEPYQNELLERFEKYTDPYQEIILEEEIAYKQNELDTANEKIKNSKTGKEIQAEINKLKKKLASLKKQPEPSFELESTEPAADSRKSKFTQQTPGNVDGSIETKTFSYQKKKNSSGAYYLVFDENENPITRDKDFGISFNDDLLANPNLINENTKVYVRPFETPYFRNEIANNPGRNPSNDYMEIPMILYIEHEGNKVAVGILKAANTTEEEQQIRNAIFQNWTKTNKEGYTVANLVPTDEDVFINFTGGQNLRNVRDDQNKPVLKPVAERWTSAWQDDGEGNIEFYTDEDVELKFGYVNKPLEGAPQIIIPQEGTSNLSREAKVLRPERSEAGQIYGVILNGNGQYIFPKLSTSQISEKAAKVISDILNQDKVSKQDVEAIQEIIFTEYENSDIIEAIASLTNVPDNRNIDPIIRIAWNHTKKNAYIQFIHNDKVYSVDVNDLKDDEPASLRRKKVVVKENAAANKKEQSLSTEGIDAKVIYNELGVHPLVIINEIIKRKKYNVRRESLNDFTEEYTSRVTGQVYKNYNDYISGRKDQNGNPNNEINNKRAILQTDIQPSSEGNYFYDLQLQITIKKEEVQEEDAEVKEESRMPEDLEEPEDKYDKFAKGKNLFGLGKDPSENPSGTIGGIPSMSPRGRFNMFLNKFNIQISGFSSIRPGKVDPVTVKQFKNEAKIFGLEGRVSTNGSLYLYDPSTKKALVKDNSPSNNPNFKLKLSRVKPIKTDYPYQTTRTKNGRTIFQLGITPIEWATTPVKEKENIINCN